MHRIRFGLILAGLLTVLTAGVAFAQEFPAPTGRLVNDFVGLMSPAVEDDLETRLRRLERDTTAEVAVVTITTLGDDTIEDYAVGLFEKWGIGKKGQDNGVLFIMALEERKARIEVGYGLEPILTDGRSGRILDDTVLPSFREGDYETGILKGVSAIEEYIRKGVLPAPLEDNWIQKLLRSPDFLPPLLIGIGIVSIYVFGFAARSKSIWLGGMWGAANGTFFGLATGRVWGFILVFLAMTGFSLFLDWILSRNYKALKSMGSSTNWGNTWGGFGGTGGFGGGFGGGGGGGFHFGGGGSGGGGASRGW